MKNTIYPCLWFAGEAKQAADFYCHVFSDAGILAHNDIITFFTLKGTKFMALNGGPIYKVNSAISYYVYCGNENEITGLYQALLDGGKTLMPLDKYPWSEKYAWVEDKFGVNWQLDISTIDSDQKILPSMLFANDKMKLIKQAIDQYIEIFPNSKSLREAPCPAEMKAPEGALLFAQYSLSGFLFNSMSSAGHDFDFTPGNSFVVECDTQEEIDHYWDKLGKDGFYSQCGWLQDQYGVSWQIVPTILAKLMSDPAKAPKVVEAFMKMKKFIIADLLSV